MRLGDLITLLYTQYKARFDDEDLAAVATAATVNDLLAKHEERKDKVVLAQPAAEA